MAATESRGLWFLLSTLRFPNWGPWHLAALTLWIVTSLSDVLCQLKAKLTTRPPLTLVPTPAAGPPAALPGWRARAELQEPS